MTSVNGQSGGRARRGFVSLRTKLIGFVSLIIVAVCSGLGWYFINQRAEIMNSSLVNTGTILAKNLAYNSRYLLFIEDLEGLGKLVDGVMEVEEVVYVVITGPEGKQLAAKSKGNLYPDPTFAKGLLASSASEPVITSFSVRGKNMKEVRVSRGQARTMFMPADVEALEDFAVPVMRKSLPQPLMPPFELESPAPQSPDKVYGVVQVGMTRAKMLATLNDLIIKAALITVLIILAGITATVLLAGRIITPLKSLAGGASRVAAGDLTVSVAPTTHDEVGQLTEVFTHMTESLKERDLAISSHIQTITKQVRELAALNKISMAIATTLDLDKLLATVLRLVIQNVGFSNARLVLYDSDRRVAYGSRLAGVPEELDREWRDVEVPVQDDGSLLAELLIHGRPVLIENIETATLRLAPFNLKPIREAGVISIVCAPLKSKERILGYIGAARGAQRCTQEDLNLLVTIAGEVAVALDNARAYRQLEHLAQSLEQRVQHRTQLLLEANRRLQELDKLKSDFVSTVSHELRTPMTSIKGYVDNILDGLTGVLTERQSYYLNRVKSNVERLTRMINELLDLSRIEAGKVELSLGNVRTREFVSEVVEGFQGMAQQKGLTLRTHQPDELPVIRCDRDKLHQVLTNLIQNAIKFTPTGGEVRVESQMLGDGYLQIGVIDTGCGIPPHELDKVFEQFYRGESGSPDDPRWGLGLAIARSLVKLHGGQIWVESTPGQGSRFYFTVQIAPPPS